MLEVAFGIFPIFYGTMGIPAPKFREGSFFFNEKTLDFVGFCINFLWHFQLAFPTLKKQLILCQWFFNVFFGHFFDFLFSGFFTILYIS